MTEDLIFSCLFEEIKNGSKGMKIFGGQFVCQISHINLPIYYGERYCKP